MAENPQKKTYVLKIRPQAFGFEARPHDELMNPSRVFRPLWEVVAVIRKRQCQFVARRWVLKEKDLS